MRYILESSSWRLGEGEWAWALALLWKDQGLQEDGTLEEAINSNTDFKVLQDVRSSECWAVSMESWEGWGPLCRLSSTGADSGTRGVSSCTGLCQATCSVSEMAGSCARA